MGSVYKSRPCGCALSDWRRLAVDEHGAIRSVALWYPHSLQRTLASVCSGRAWCDTIGRTVVPTLTPAYLGVGLQWTSMVRYDRSHCGTHTHSSVPWRRFAVDEHGAI